MPENDCITTVLQDTKNMLHFIRSPGHSWRKTNYILTVCVCWRVVKSIEGESEGALMNVPLSLRSRHTVWRVRSHKESKWQLTEFVFQKRVGGVGESLHEAFRQVGVGEHIFNTSERVIEAFSEVHVCFSLIILCGGHDKVLVNEEVGPNKEA